MKLIKMLFILLLLMDINLITANTVYAIPGYKYNITDIGALINSHSTARAINDSGQVVGQSGSGTAGHAFVWENDVLTDIGAVGGGLGAAGLEDRSLTR